MRVGRTHQDATKNPHRPGPKKPLPMRQSKLRDVSTTTALQHPVTGDIGYAPRAIFGRLPDLRRPAAIILLHPGSAQGYILMIIAEPKAGDKAAAPGHYSL